MKRLLSLLVALALSPAAQAVDYPQPIGATAARTFPNATIGQLLFSSGRYYYSGSGTVIRPSSVLTAAHNLWDADSGFSTDILFRRGQYGATYLSQQYASRIYVLSGYRENARRYGGESVRAFSYDLGALVFPRQVASGASAGWWANPALLRAGVETIALGYGGEYHTGDDLLSVASRAGYAPVLGGFYENDALYFEAGMSGGPVFGTDGDGKKYVAGVVVASSVEPVTGGIRILNGTAASFIRRYMK
jgi:V8-like Glu-specific endopeptidase